jgi:hypothetical protein
VRELFKDGDGGKKGEIFKNTADSGQESNMGERREGDKEG